MKVDTLVALCLPGLVQAGTQLNVEPRSGIIVRGDQKEWFDRRPTAYDWERRISLPEWESSSVTTTSFSSDGERIQETQTVVDRNHDGERTTGPTERVRGFDDEIRVCDYRLDGLWRGLRMTGTEDMLGFTADVLVAEWNCRTTRLQARSGSRLR